MMHVLNIARRDWLAMRRHAQRRLPCEACGLLAGRGDDVEMVIGMRNIARSQVRFLMSPRGLWRAFSRLEDLEMELIGIYHSHPDGPAQPSPTDIQEAMYPVVHVIWSRQGGIWQAGGFWIEGGRVSPAGLLVH